MNDAILIVEDEAELCLTLGDRLSKEGYSVEFALDGATGMQRILGKTYDLLILDLLLPAKSGFELCVQIRERGMRIPILVLTALSQTIEKVTGLKLGADDYVTKPFDTMELMLRIDALLRRSRIGASGNQQEKTIYRLGGLLLDVRRNAVIHNGETVNLTDKEFQLLWYLADRGGEIISRNVLLTQVWGQIPGTLTRTVDIHIASIRQKLQWSPKQDEFIITIPGVGYKFQA